MLDSIGALQLTSEYCVDLMPEWHDLDLKIDALTGGITNKLFRIQLPDGEEPPERHQRAAWRFLQRAVAERARTRPTRARPAHYPQMLQLGQDIYFIKEVLNL